MTHTIDNITCENVAASRRFRTEVTLHTTSASTTALTAESTGYHNITGSAAGFSLKLGIGTSYAVGHHYRFHNAATQSVNILNYSNALLLTIQADQHAFFTARNVDASDAVWDYAVVSSSAFTPEELPVCQVRRTTDVAITASWAAITWDTIDVQNNTAILERDGTVTSRILIKESGYYMFQSTFTLYDADGTATAFARTRLFKNATTEIPGSRGSTSYWGHGVNVDATAALLAAGDYVEVQCILEGGAVPAAFLQPSNLTVWRMKGAKGDTGATGSGSSLIVQNNGTSLPNTPHSTLNFKDIGSVTDQGGGVALIQALVGSYLTQVESVVLSTTTSSTFQLKLRLTTATVPAGVYRLGWAYEWQITSTSSDFEARILQDGVTVLATHREEVQDAATTQKHSVGRFKYVTLTNAVHTFDVEYRSVSASGTARIENVGLEFWRIS